MTARGRAALLRSAGCALLLACADEGGDGAAASETQRDGVTGASESQRDGGAPAQDAQGDAGAPALGSDDPRQGGAAGDHADDPGGEGGGQLVEPVLMPGGALDFGSVRVGDAGRLTLAFDLPAHAPPFVVVVDPLPEGGRVGLRSLRGPGDELLFEAGAGGPFVPAQVRNDSDVFPFTMMLPTAPQLLPAAGRYEVELEVAPGTHVWPAVILQEPPSGRQPMLRSALWVTGAGGIDGASVRADAALVAAMAEVGEIFASAGVDVGAIDVFDLRVGSAALEIRSDEDLLVLSELIDPTLAMPINIVFVESIEIGGQPMRGRTTSVPLPPMRTGRGHRGVVAIALDMLPGEPERIAELWAHELAHALGLRHTSELDGLAHDPLADTPECPPERASQSTPDGTLFLSPEDCLGLGGDNLLFPTPPSGGMPQRALSADQVEMLLASPVLL